MASAIGASINEIVKHGVAPALTAAGFERQARAFHRRRGEGIDVVTVQPSKWNARGEGKFTVNLGIYFPAVERLLSPEPVIEAPGDGNCHARRRLGQLMPTENDHWWSIDKRTDLRALSAEVEAGLTAFGLPWFESVPDVRAAVSLLEAEESYYIAAAAWLACGDRAAARRDLAIVIQRFPTRDMYRTWGEQHGLLGTTG